MQNKTQMAVHGLGRGEGLGFAGLFGTTKSWLVRDQCAASGQLNLVLPALWNGAVCAPLGNCGLRASQSHRGAGLRAVMRDEFLWGHASLSEFRCMLSIGVLIK